MTRPVFAFGKVFAVTAHAGAEFMALHPAKAGWLAMPVGAGLTAALTLVVGMLMRRRGELERLVVKRTRELRERERSYRDQFASNSSPMLLVDSVDGAIIDANAAALGFYGHPRDSFAGNERREPGRPASRGGSLAGAWQAIPIPAPSGGRRGARCRGVVEPCPAWRPLRFARDRA